MSAPEVLFFDVGGTLLDPHPSVGHIYAEVASDFGLTLDPKSTHRAFAKAFHQVKPRLLKERGYFFGYDTEAQRAMWREVIEGTFQSDIDAEFDLDGLFERLWTEMARPERYALLPGVIETLDQLKSTRLGIISNWDERLRPVLDGMGLTPRFDPIVISCEVGSEKPDRGIYDMALEMVGVPAEKCLMVGDTHGADVLGSQAVGMRAVLLDRWDNAPADCASITSIPGLLPWLDQCV